MAVGRGVTEGNSDNSSVEAHALCILYLEGTLGHGPEPSQFFIIYQPRHVTTFCSDESTPVLTAIGGGNRRGRGCGRDLHLADRASLD